MAHSILLKLPGLAAALCLALPGFGQSPDDKAQVERILSDATAPTLTLKTFSRMVTLELVVKDSKGNHIKDLKADDFKLYEQTAAQKNEKHEQKIASFREVRMANMANPIAPESQISPGVYTNAITVQKDPVPATIILVDGLNTDPQNQAQVHMQMMRMLQQLPSNVPVAVFLLGDRLRMLQNFTTDPHLLKLALGKAISTAGKGYADVDPRDDSQSNANVMARAYGLTDPSSDLNATAGSSSSSSSVSTSQANSSSDPVLVGMVELAQEFDMKVYASTMDERIHRTFDALISLGHNVAGYPGRKNLLWLSTEFPINLIPQGNTPLVQFGGAGASPQSSGDIPGVVDPWSGYRDYWKQLKYLDTVLSDAKISVYPVNVAGVQTLDLYRAETSPPSITPTVLADALNRNVENRNSEHDTMQMLADGTGGKVCTGDNDLSDCIRKAIDDSSDFYEISYYPDSADWNGEFRKILVKTGERDAHLSYREGYFANPEGSNDSKMQAAQMQSDCDDYLDATAIAFRAKTEPAGSSGNLKFTLLIDSSGLSLSPTADGRHQLSVALAVCTYNDRGWPLKLMNYPVNLKLSPQQYDTLNTTGRLMDSISLPGPLPAAVRLLVKDVVTGKLGSVYIKTDDLVATAPAANQATQQATPQ